MAVLTLDQELACVLQECKAIILRGVSGSGKIILSKYIAERLKNDDFKDFANGPKTSVTVEVIPCHPNLSYSDIVIVTYAVEYASKAENSGKNPFYVTGMKGSESLWYSLVYDMP